MTRELIYVGDPMCSWCWGMSPVIEQMEGRYGLPLRLVLGGLRPGQDRPMDEYTRQIIAHHWHQVETRTGQPFDHDFLEETPDFVYDTAPSCAAVVAMRNLDPKQALPYFRRIQEGFYVEGRDVTDDTVLAELAAEFPVDQGRHAELLGSEENRKRTWDDFREARAMGVTGFPTVLLKSGTVVYPIAFGYAPLDQVDDMVERRLSPLDPSPGEACAPGEAC